MFNIKLVKIILVKIIAQDSWLETSPFSLLNFARHSFESSWIYYQTMWIVQVHTNAAIKNKIERGGGGCLF